MRSWLQVTRGSESLLASAQFRLPRIIAWRAGMGALLLLAALSSGCAGRDSVSVHIPREQIQARVATKFPITKQELFLKAVFTNPHIRLDPVANRIGIDVKARISVTPGAAIGGRVSLDGDLVYEPASGEFFVRNIRLADAHIDSVPPDVATALRQIGGISTVEYPFRELCKHFPPKISDIKAGQLPDDWKGRAARCVLRRLVIKADGIDAEVGLPRGG